MEAHKVSDLVDPNVLINNKTTLLEHLTKTAQDKGEVRDTLIEEYSNYDKDLKLLTFRILLEKFNSKYDTLLPEQKSILREFITSVDSSTKLRSIVNEEVGKLLVKIKKLKESTKDDILKIKLQEVLKSIKPLSNKEKVEDIHLVNIMQYYELIKELKGL